MTSQISRVGFACLSVVALVATCVAKDAVACGAGLAYQQQGKTNVQKAPALLSPAFKAAATEAFGKLETLRATVCLQYQSAWDTLAPQAEKAVDKASNLARTKAELALGGPVPATEADMAQHPAGRLASYEFRLSGSHLAPLIAYARNGGWAGCEDHVAGYCEDRLPIMKALGLTEEAAARLVGKVPAPTDKEIAEKETIVRESSDDIDHAIGMYTRAVAVAHRLEAWYQVNPEHPQAKAMQEDWCGNQAGLAQQVAALPKTDDLRFKDAMVMPGVDPDLVQGVADKMQALLKLTRTLHTERSRLEGMGCSCK